MNTKLKKIIIVLAVVTFLFSGCDGIHIGSDEPVITETQKNPVYENLPRTTLDVYLSYVYSLYGEDKLNVCMERLNEICQEDINAEVNLYAFTEIAYDQEVRKVIDSGQPIDILMAIDGMTYGTYGDRPVDKWLEIGMAADITDLVSTYYPSGMLRIDKYKDRVIHNDRIYGIPIVLNGMEATGVWMPKKMSREIDEISNFEDVKKVIDKTIEEDLSLYISYRQLYDLWLIDQGLYPYGTFCIDMNSGNVYPVENLNLADFMDVARKYFSYPKAIKDMKMYDQKAAGTDVHFFSYLGSRTYNSRGYYFEKHGNIYDKDLRLINMPYSFSESERCKGAIVIAETSLNKERSLLFLDYVHQSEEASKVLIYGIEKKTYSVNESEEILWTDTGMWGEDIANMAYDDIPYHFEPDYSLYRDLTKRVSIDSAGVYRQAAARLSELLTIEQEDTFSSRAFLFFGIQGMSVGEMISTYDADDLSVMLAEKNRDQLEIVLTEHMKRLLEIND